MSSDVTEEAGALEIRGPARGLFDDPLALRARGAGPAGDLVWRARLRDDDDRVWRSRADRAEDLALAWVPVKDTTGPFASLHSLRPVGIDVRVESPDGRAAARTVTRVFVGDGVRVRRWRDGVAATLYLPAGEPCATVLVDATAGPTQLAVAGLAAPLLASRGALVLTLAPGRAGEPAGDDLLIAARERLAAVPGASARPELLPVLDPFATPAGVDPGAAVGLPPGVGARDSQGAAAARAAAWDALLARLDARARTAPA
jgi:hypothetical protein